MRCFFKTTTVALAFMLCLSGLVLSGTAFAERCVDNWKTVTDNGTGLMWQKSPAGPMNWDAAKDYASGLSLGGHSDWQLPSKDQLLGLYNSPCNNMMDLNNSSYWSGTTYVDNTRYAWRVHFLYGNVYKYLKSISYYVRAVRRAQ